MIWPEKDNQIIMCYHYKQPKGIGQIAKRFQVHMFDFDDFVEHSFNGFDHPLKMVISDRKPKTVGLASWGLMPTYVKDPKEFKANTLNARIEDLDINLYKEYSQNRCLVLAEEFYEWKHINNIAYKHRIFSADGEPFAFAGLYSNWHGKDTFTIVTTEANDLMADIHNTARRMPVVLKRNEESLWLGGEEALNFKNRKEVQLLAEPLDNLPLQLF